jgi:transposase-like protein
MFSWRMSTEKTCPNCRATMRLETRTLGFLSFECPKCAFVVIEVAKENAPQGRAVPGRG